MQQTNPDPKLADEAREAMNAAVAAMAEYHNEITASSEKVVTRIARAARALGWPDDVVSVLVVQMQSTARMQTALMDGTLEVWRENIRTWPGLHSLGKWPDVEALKAMSLAPAHFGTRIGGQWQNWAQRMMAQWAELSKQNLPPKSGDRE